MAGVGGPHLRHPDGPAPRARRDGGQPRGWTGQPRVLADIAYTLNARRRFERYRVVLATRTPRELIGHLRAASATLKVVGDAPVLPLAVSKLVNVYDAGEPDTPAPKLAFCFAGQGAKRSACSGAPRSGLGASTLRSSDWTGRRRISCRAGSPVSSTPRPTPRRPRILTPRPKPSGDRDLPAGHGRARARDGRLSSGRAASSRT